MNGPPSGRSVFSKIFGFQMGVRSQHYCIHLAADTICCCTLSPNGCAHNNHHYTKRGKMRRVSVLIAMGTAMLGFASAAPAQSNHQVVKATYGCQSKDVFDKLVHYSVDNDNVAFKKGLTAAIYSGQCSIFQAGEAVELADVAMFSGTVKVRRRGDTDEYWTFMERVK
jgi:hypothetical protein